MTRFCFSSLRVRLLLLVLIAALPALGLILHIAVEQRELAAVQAQEEALRLVRLASKEHEKLIKDTHRFLTVIAQLPEVRSTDPAMCSSIFNDLLKRYPLYTNIGVINPDGELLCSALPVRGPINLADRAYFQRALQTRDFAIGNYQVGRVTGKTSINFGYPVLDKAGHVQAVIFAALDLTWLNQLVTEVELLPGATLTVIDRTGTVLARYPEPEKWVGQSVPESSIVQTIFSRQGEGTSESIGMDGTPRLYAFRPLYEAAGGGDIWITVGIPTKVVFADANRLLTHNLIGLGLVTALMLAIAWAGGNLFLLRRVNALLGATQRLAAGDLGTRSGLPHDQGELGQLAHAFDNMAMALEQRTVQLSQAENKYRTLVEQTPAVTYITSLNKVSTMLYISPQIESMLGFSLTEWLADPGLWNKQLHPDDRERVLAELAHSQASGKPFRSEYRLLSQDGRVVWVHNEARVVLDEAGQPQFLQGIMLDITERKRTEDALRENEEKFRQLFNNANDAICLHELTDDDGMPGRFIEVNDVFCRRLGYSKDEFFTMSPKDIDAKERWNEVPRIMQQFLAKGHIIFEMTHVSKNGLKIPVEISSHLCILNGKKVVLSIARDITERKQMENLLRESEEKYRTIFENTGTAIAILEEDTTISMGNTEMERLSGYSKEEVEGKKSWTEFVVKDDLERLKEYHGLRRVDSNAAPKNYEFRFIDKQGNIKEIFMTVVMIPGTKKSVASLLDITERKQVEEQLKYLSLHDPLTGLYNRAYFEQEMDRLESGRHNPVSIIVCDVDGLKLINDTMGHDTGDKILLAAAGIIRESFREDDVAARIGGDEFAILLPNSDRTVVENTSQRIRDAIVRYNKANPEILLSISVGFAVSNETPAMMADLFKEADNNMYREKLHHKKVPTAPSFRPL